MDMITNFSYTGAFMVGLMGAGHCMGMCGGIVGALSCSLPHQDNKWSMMLCYHLGRIGAYSMAGGLAASLTWLVSHIVSMQLMLIGLRLAAGCTMILIGLYVANLWLGIQRLEAVGHQVWRVVQPYAQRAMHIQSKKQAWLAGSLWGWLPCGLVYSALTWALASGDPLEGALLMFMFGLGTLPGLLTFGLFAQQLHHIVRHRAFKWCMGGMFVLFGLQTCLIAGQQLSKMA